jgi:hypothetical protein
MRCSGGVTHYIAHKAGGDDNRDQRKPLESLYRIDNEVF